MNGNRRSTFHGNSFANGNMPPDGGAVGSYCEADRMSGWIVSGPHWWLN